MGKKKQHHEEHVDETWLIPYSDMLTLLLALFIVMFAMSKVDQEKIQKAGKEFNQVFAGSNGVLDGSGTEVSGEEEAGASAEITGEDATKTEEDKMNEVKKMIDQEIATEGYADKVKTELNGDGLEISIQDVVLFNSGDAEVVGGVSPLLLKISAMIRNLDNEIKVVGHTDNVPISNQKFRSNWDLSSMRAVNVMNFMVNSGGVHPNKVSIQAYGEYAPKYDNSTEDGRARNRRVEIFVVRKFPLSNEQQKTTP
ncbi:OmpA family protein [Clostridium sp. SHJSY1]|uniref:flagellar motor protein MotB n=1 Tax=Clostridium sp. SHJSY1 TaxID=2942483 RepID=UPI0028755F1F|nr:flagellar motor protein MotB [Clostridium sp. SHJSY1]MDS0528279.1 OmpA family protein [Clostridium sp. SHJSY1]